MNSKQKNTLMIIVIVVAFVSPVALSYYLIGNPDIVEQRGLSNKGSLVSPPRPINDMQLLDPVADTNYPLHGKWNLVYVTDVCDKACFDNLYRMRQIHIAMDKHSLRVQRVLLMTSAQHQSLMPDLNEYAGQRVIVSDNKQQLLNTFQLHEGDQPVKANRLYIVDPIGNLMMSYPPDINPRGIMTDLKKLLKASRIG